MTRKFPWGELMHFGLRQLRLAPQDFWRSTLRELAAARGLSTSPAGQMRRMNLLDLIKEFPDKND